MPELPEIETICRGLNPFIKNSSILGIKINTTKLRYEIPGDLLKEKLPGSTINQISRRSKYLLFHLTNKQFLIVHLGMSGRILWLSRSTPLQKHDHLQIFFPGDMELRLRDPRRFGMVDITSSLENYKFFKHLGVEPLSSSCTASYFLKKSRKSKKPVKNFIMDASIVVGVGNIYANEALFLSGLRPTKPAGKLNMKNWQDVTISIKKVLRQAIQRGGTTINDFQNGQGEPGYFQNYLRVYGRDGEFCKKCKTMIKRVVIAGRSSFYCPKCQK